MYLATQRLKVEQITRRFYDRFKAQRVAFLTCIQGIPTEVERERYASSMLNRLMFIYFLQKKGFLDSDTNYLLNRLHLTQSQQGRDVFYRHFLLRLLHEGPGAQLRSPELIALFGNVPYLNKGLFTVHEVERDTIQIPDIAFEALFTFFDTQQWQMKEHSLQNDNELTPSILGYIFEKYVNQQQMGAYYTKEDVTEYIARNTIIPALFDAVEQQSPASFRPGGAIWQMLKERPDRYIYEAVSSEVHLPTETAHKYSARRSHYRTLRAHLEGVCTIDDFITYNVDISRFAQDVLTQCEEPALLHTFYKCIEKMTILDPTCGSGAFLFAALKVLAPLYEACIERMHTFVHKQDQHKRSLDDLRAILTWVAEQPNHRYFIIKSILLNNLYGVDIMEEATELCRLRLFLELLAQVERAEDIGPLPDIEDNIRAGNALVGFVTSRRGTSCVVEMLGASRPRTQSYPAILHQVRGHPQEVPLRDDANVQSDTLCAQLDRNLAGEYGIDPNDTLAFEQWRASHQPFHWFIEFDEVMKNGGFDVIIGNPPYVEYDDKRFPYTLQNFATRSCANLYPCVIERSHHLLSPQGRHAMILPLAAFATRNMTPLIEGFQQWFPCTWFSFYHFRPSMLFSGGKVASIPTTIYLAKACGQEKRFSTHVAKWPTENRNLLFPSLTYCQVTAPKDPENRHYYPKFGCSLENSIMEKVLRHNTVSRYLASIPNENTMYYRSAGGLYWKVFINFAWPYQTTSNKHCSFRGGYDREVFVALFNSSLFWWYYTVTFDTFNLKDYMLFGFRFSYPQDDALINALQACCQDLMNSFKRNAQHLKRGKTGSYTVYAKKSKSIIDDIDRVLAQHYGFTNEELDFIINYDIKYRMGQDYGSESSLHNP